MIDDKSTDFEVICDFGVLYKAYQKSKSGKGYSKSRERFQNAAMDGLYQIKRRLETKTYQVSPYYTIIVKEPKERIVMVGSFKDNIVQHSLCDNVLLPILKDEFVKTNYAGQLGKGTLFGLDCLKEQMLTAFNMYGHDCWIIKADITKYFYSIDHDILKDIVRYFVEDDDVFWLCEKFIDSIPNPGLPLGNQLSQVFGLMYLSGLDHFILEELGIQLFGRYADDFYMIVNNKEYAEYCLNAVREYTSTLNLKLNGKTQLIPFKNGIKFCGFHTYVTKDGKAIRKLLSDKKRTARKKYFKMAKLVKNGKLSVEKFYESYNSWKNHVSHGNCFKLICEMDKFVEQCLSN